ncbi:endonuclease [Ignicoccus islandicus DSM 13165]|uniref:Flap endonuclease 1 n=1 Tax=Ignicoccus islandicus DSM 13165 TaxID=940295 RepID=A0A0U3FRE3_9CREN|nr:flap endonuclease-1 [Ignicoccus islandicus]ALU12048.1 endonuclease [Ignicoccus islandicus DSM 13165]
MGIAQLREIIPQKCVTNYTLKALEGRKIALDGFNSLYQFLTAIRGPDGKPLMDSRGNVTSHLAGLFYRTVNLLENGIRVAYVFDGKPPDFKKKEIERRLSIKEKAEKMYKEAISKGIIEEAKKYAQMSTRLTPAMVADAKKLLELMGVPWVQAPSEGEAQAAYMAQKGSVWASGSQDYDSLLFGSPRLIRNLVVSGKRKLPGKNVYVNVEPEEIKLDCILKDLDISREQLIDIALLVGTDYTEGIKGIGPKTALRLVKTYKDLEKILRSYNVEDVEYYLKVKEFFLNPPVTDDYVLEWREPDIEGLIEFLVREHDFNEERVRRAAERLKKAWREKIRSRQLGLDAFFSKKS